LSDYQKTERALQPRWEGPFEIVEKLSDLTFLLKLPAKFREIHPVFNAAKLKPNREPEIEGQQVDPPPPTMVKGVEEHEVEKILQHRTRGRSKQYLVRWKGFTRAEDTWEPASNLKNAKKAIQEYKKKGFTEPAKRKSTREKKTRLISEENSEYFSEEDEVPRALMTIPKSRVLN
jgi:hypothetical protein